MLAETKFRYVHDWAKLTSTKATTQHVTYKTSTNMQVSEGDWSAEWRCLKPNYRLATDPPDSSFPVVTPSSCLFCHLETAVVSVHVRPSSSEMTSPHLLHMAKPARPRLLKWISTSWEAFRGVTACAEARAEGRTKVLLGSNWRDNMSQLCWWFLVRARTCQVWIQLYLNQVRIPGYDGESLRARAQCWK